MPVQIDTHVEDNLETGELKSLTRTYNLKAAEVVVRGQVLGLITASGLLATFDSTAIDGTENPHSIASHDADQAVADRMAAYVHGSFNSNPLTFIGGDVAADVVEALGDKGIYIKESQERG